MHRTRPAGLRGFGFRVPRQTGKIQIEPGRREVDEADHATLREVMCNTRSDVQWFRKPNTQEAVMFA
jgi:hypothetical protein